MIYMKGQKTVKMMIVWQVILSLLRNFNPILKFRITVMQKVVFAPLKKSAILITTS